MSLAEVDYAFSHDNVHMYFWLDRNKTFKIGNFENQITFFNFSLRRMTVYSSRAPKTKMMQAITQHSIAVRPSACQLIMIMLLMLLLMMTMNNFAASDL